MQRLKWEGNNYWDVRKHEQHTSRATNLNYWKSNLQHIAL